MKNGLAVINPPSMKSLPILYSLAATVMLLPARAIPPIPEPGIVIYGKVTDSSRNSVVAINSLNWTITSNGKSVTLTLGSGIEISALNDETWFIARLPFVSTRVEGANVDPVPASAFESMTVPTVYSHYFMEVNGVSAQIALPAGGSSTFPSSASALELGRTEQINLVVPHNLGAAYSSWAIARWGNVFASDASPLADPDHDGKSNEHEFTAGSDPADAKSNLSASATSLTGGQFNFRWQSVPGKTYQIETSATPSGPWAHIGSPVLATQNLTSSNIAVAPQISRQFFRVRIVQ